ncbi:MAG: geranylgeranyl reductase family protein [Candidatus Hodarchaeota archaeon]
MMSDPDFDVIIIGGGPAGLIAARTIAKSGHNVMVAEEHSEIGVPDHCAGLLSSSGLKRLGLKPPKDVIQNHVSGARIYSPGGHSILIERGRREAFVLDRRRFDSWLAHLAQECGATVQTDAKVTALQRVQGDGWNVVVRGVSSGKNMTSKIVISAEGSRCQISSSIGFPKVPRKNKYAAYQYEVANTDVDEDVVEMFYGQRIAPGFFAWIIPLGDRRARIGLAAKDRTKVRLEAMMKHHPFVKKQLGKVKIERGFGGVVLVGLPTRRTYTEGALVVGDAAGMTKPTTGGGVILGGIAAQIAGDVTSKALDIGNVAKSHLRSYEERWRAVLVPEVRAMILVQRVLGSLSDKGFDSLIKDAKDYDLINTVRNQGDMDMQRKVIVRLLSEPGAFLAGIKAIRYLNPLI